MAIDVFPCEDGHAHERVLLGPVLATVSARDLWITDHNFCVRDSLCGIAALEAYLISRQHQRLSWKAVSPQRYAGHTETTQAGRYQRPALP
jgi:hypothetical protein